MSSPFKSDSKLSELKPSDARLLIYGSLCHDRKIDFDKLASLTGMKKTSANTNYWRAKNHLEQILDANAGSDSGAVRPKGDDAKSEDTDAGQPKKTGSGAKRGAAQGPSTKKESSKRRKTVAKTASEVVKSAQDEQAADDTDRTE
ncbi:hypothetical protein PITC_074570 [Penicillium italicum]|uniref:Uncharacterized protein n=1 Tax=Penicillium italicum TaxID=40296 RepID=A0A0A2LEM0_PENIT|nr:hypothetical protein PITC_074570 [Penicillium italicum]